jgi:hypothetical protein
MRCDALAGRSLAPEVPEPGRRQLGVSNGVLDVLVSEPGLQRARVVTFVGKSESAGVAKAWGRTGNGILARSPMRANNPWNDFGVIGPPRSVKKTCCRPSALVGQNELIASHFDPDQP